MKILYWFHAFCAYTIVSNILVKLNETSNKYSYIHGVSYWYVYWEDIPSRNIVDVLWYFTHFTCIFVNVYFVCDCVQKCRYGYIKKKVRRCDDRSKLQVLSEHYLNNEMYKLDICCTSWIRIITLCINLHNYFHLIFFLHLFTPSNLCLQNETNYFVGNNGFVAT